MSKTEPTHTTRFESPSTGHSDAPYERADTETSLRAASEQNANKASVHRDEDGNVLAISIVLSPVQVAVHGLPDGVDTVCPVVGPNSITLVPADYTR